MLPRLVGVTNLSASLDCSCVEKLPTCTFNFGQLLDEGRLVYYRVIADNSTLRRSPHGALRWQSLHHPTGLLLLLYIKEFDSCTISIVSESFTDSGDPSSKRSNIGETQYPHFRHKQLESGHWHEDCFPNGAAMKKILAFALLTMGLNQRWGQPHQS